jgi:hypothetical protein
MSLNETNLSTNYITLSNEELREKMKTSCATIGKRLYIFKSQLHNCDSLLEENYSDRDLINTNFDDIELIEENLDELFDKYKKIKSDIANARMARYYYMENKMQHDN